MQITAQELATLIGGKVEGDPTIIIHGPSKIEEGLPGTVSFLANPKYEPFIYDSKASVILVEKDFEPSKPISATLIRVEQVYEKVAMLLNKFGDLQQEEKKAEIHPSAVVHESAEVDGSVSLGANTVVEKSVRIGAGTTVYPQVYLGSNVEVGKNCIIYPGVKIYKDCKIGDGCILHSNCVIGSDGFGFAPAKSGYEKIEQLGKLIIGSNVEIGAGCTIDRGAIENTEIHDGVKLDNNIHIAHNVILGANSAIAASCAIAGSSVIGKNFQMGGLSGVLGHLNIADNVTVGAHTLITKNITKSGNYIGIMPAQEHKDWTRSSIFIKKRGK